MTGIEPQEFILLAPEMLLAVDDGLGRIMETLEAQGILDDTFVLFTSDNGFFYGEHNLSLERRLPYEESIRTPLIVRYPPVTEAGERVEGLVASVDLAPTVLEVEFLSQLLISSSCRSSHHEVPIFLVPP